MPRIVLLLAFILIGSVASQVVTPTAALNFTVPIDPSIITVL